MTLKDLGFTLLEIRNVYLSSTSFNSKPAKDLNNLDEDYLKWYESILSSDIETLRDILVRTPQPQMDDVEIKMHNNILEKIETKKFNAKVKDYIK